MSKPTLLFYCQHSLGMGHLIRSFALVRAFSRHYRVVFLNGGRLPASIAVPEGMEIVQLPALGMNASKRLVSLDDDFTLEAAQTLRKRMILHAYRKCRPAVLIIELFPFGRKKFRNELIPLLEAARTDSVGSPIIYCSLRDILVGGRDHQQKHDDAAAQTLDDYFDGVLIHADPRFARLEESFKPSRPVSVPVHYTGFVRPHPKTQTGEVRRNARVLVSAGSGKVGGALFRAAVEAHQQLWELKGLPMTIVTGPFFPEREWLELESATARRPGLTVLRSVPNLAAEMCSVRWSVSQCGYNTAMDVLSTGVAASFVPFSAPGEDEQMNRAQRMAQRKVARLLPPERLDGASLAREIEDLLDFEPAAAELDLDGAKNAVQIVLKGWEPLEMGSYPPAQASP